MKDQILQILMLSKFTKRRELLHGVITNGFYITDRALRSTIEEMITKDHYAIGSNEKGYYLITTEADLDEAMHQLKHRAEQLSIRANCLLRNHREGKLTEQLALFV